MEINDLSPAMQFTGERMVPEAAEPNIFWEHVFRYSFACRHVKNLNVLDIASGEGYGTHAISKVAKRVVGVDISADAVAHAKIKYGHDYRVGSADRIPVESTSLDAVISFETIEHVPEPRRFVEEVFRVLRPDGLFLVSTPNKDVYHKGQAPNPFHCSEMTRSEFVNCLSPHFVVKSILGQVFPKCPLDDLQRIVGMLSDRLGYYLRRQLENPFKRRFLPDSITSDAVERRRIIESIPSLSPPLNWFWNPFAIGKVGRSEWSQPTYLVAVAAKRVQRS